MVCPTVRGDHPFTLSSGLFDVHVDIPWNVYNYLKYCIGVDLAYNVILRLKLVSDILAAPIICSNQMRTILILKVYTVFYHHRIALRYNTFLIRRV